MYQNRPEKLTVYILLSAPYLIGLKLHLKYFFWNDCHLCRLSVFP